MAANPLLGQADFVAGDQRYTLAYDVNAMILAEEATGLETPHLLDALDRGASLKVLRAVVWAGLQRKHPDTILLEAGEIIQQATPAVASEAMRKAIAAAFPPASGEKGANPPKAADGAGSTGSSGGRRKG